MIFSIPVLTWICLGIIVVVFVICLILVFYYRSKDTLIANHRTVEYFPTFVSTLGVLGTFLGITTGLIAFDSKDLDESIPQLLDGLKTAFFTSLAGMIGSMILSAIISRKQDEKDNGVSDINQAAVTICQAVQQMSKLNSDAIGDLKQQMEQQEADRKAFYRSIGDVMDSIRQSQVSASSALDSLVILQRSQESSLGSIKETSAAMTVSVGNLEETATTQLSAFSTLQSSISQISESTYHIGEILDVLSGMSGTQDAINEHLDKLKDLLDAEVNQIEESMDKTNKLLEHKFDEFTELLKKSNTEALVEVMKKVTEEFQKQMNALINKLIQENFDQLNKSVERLIQWQQENKEMIASLTLQYREMADNFEGTSTSLVRVKDDTETLVAEGGKLHQIVEALNQVIVQDEKFIQTANHLQKTAELSKSNMEAFNESTKALNEWVRKQRNFVDGVTLLIEKLEQISKIKDYNEEFWKGTQKSLNEGVGILNTTAKNLHTNLTDIDRQFYNRLNATLGNLDACIQAMINGKK